MIKFLLYTALAAIFTLAGLTIITGQQAKADFINPGMDCMIYKEISFEYNRYQSIANKSSGLKKLVALKRLEGMTDMYATWGILCFNSN